MKQINIAINGFGRIGMLTSRVIVKKYPWLNIKAVNDLSPKAKLLKSYKNDEVYGKFNQALKAAFFQEKDPLKLPWGKLDIDVVLECSGFFKEKEEAEKHLKAGAKKVVVSAPSATLPTYLLGVNFENYNEEKIISMGSCTTNASSPVLKVINEKFGVEKCFLNTTHSYTQGQNKVYPNWQREKASKLSIIPATTGASKSIEACLPALKGKITGVALRVPTATVSLVDLVISLKKQASKEKLNQVLKEASQKSPLKGILKVVDKKMISADLRGSEFSSIVEAELTQTNGSIARIMAWYDNEWGYCSRLAQMASLINK